jgi:cytochrome c biogenesis protein CcdA
MTYVVLGLLSVVCVELFFRLKLPETIAVMARVARGAVGVLVSSELSDAEKEVAARKGSLDLLKATFAFTTRFLLICVVVYVADLLIARFLPERRDEIVRFLFSPIGIVALTIAMVGYVWMRNAVRQKL